jgi:hypothetical protein
MHGLIGTLIGEHLNNSKDLSNYLMASKDFASIRDSFIYRMDTSHMMFNEIHNIKMFMSKWGQIIKEVNALQHGQDNPFVTLCLREDETAVGVLTSCETLYIEFSILVRIVQETSIRNLPNLKTLYVTWTCAQLNDMSIFDKISHIAPNIQCLSLVCLDENALALFSDVPLLTKYPSQLNTLIIKGYMQVHNLGNTNIEYAFLEKALVFDSLPKSLLGLEMDKSLPIDARHWMTNCYQLKRLSFVNTSVSQFIPEPVWRDVIGPTLEVYEEYNTYTHNCLHTRHLMNVRSFSISGNIDTKHCIGIPRSPVLVSVYLKGVTTCHQSDFFHLRRLQSVYLEDCVFGNLSCTKFTQMN